MRRTPGAAVDAALANVPLRRLPAPRPGRRVTAALAPELAPVDPSSYPLATPWGSSELTRLVAADVFGLDDLPLNSRQAAMRIPAIARARNLVATQIARMPLRVLRGDTILTGAEAPTWTYESSQVQTWAHRLAWTVDDLIFTGWSCWSRTNGADGFPGRVTRLDRARWTIDADARVVIDERPAKPDEVIVIPGLHEGVLAYGADAVRDTTSLYRIVRARLLAPVPGLDLHQVSGEDLTDAEIDALIDRWAAARQGRNAGVSYTNRHIEARAMGAEGDAQLLIEARNAAAVEMARLVGVHAGMLDATAPKASLNYETNTGRNQEFVDLDLALYMLPITARLSLDDVVPRGQRVEFDLGDFTSAAPSITGPTRED